ncbi:MAG: hypothetical protein KDI37_18005 [Xanthomonadales bacterium]|nr:hypothetical protein [Xanthomonadales bacterium]MCB1643631.1 hypothetical protein [Xanthomonadales bacterium]
MSAHAGTLPESPAPTFEHLSLVWELPTASGHEVRVRFRPTGNPEWRAALPLFAVQAGSNSGFSWPQRHAGSLFGLTPGTAYEVELQHWQDGQLQETRFLAASTRLPAQPDPDGTLRPATPATLAGILGTAQPGDIITLGAGSYAGFSPSRDGIAGQPITLRGHPDAIITGEIGLFFRQHWILEDLQMLGRIRLNGSNDITVRNSRIEASPTQFNGDTIVCFLRCERLHIVGNELIGTTIWQESAFGANGNNRGEGVTVTGPGHVIEDNLVVGFRDGISLLEDTEAVDQYSVDILRNRIEAAADDAIEADFCIHNCRSVGNTVVDAFIAFSAQPTLGGPNFFLRNSAYNVAHVAFKLYRTSRGDVLLHNTVIKNGDAFGAYPGVPIGTLYARNNLFIGGPGGTWNGFSSGSGRVIDLQSLELASASLDYNGYGSSSGFAGRFGTISFNNLSELRNLTTEWHAQQLSLAGSFATPPAFPTDPTQRHSPPDLSLAAASAAVDAGQPLPNINVDHAGGAPDLGAFELGPADSLFANGFE